MSSGTSYKAQYVTVKQNLSFAKSILNKQIRLIEKFPDFNNLEVNLTEIDGTQDLKSIKNRYLSKVKIINDFLSISHNLTKKEKLDFCIIQRYYMKLYLKQFSHNILK